MDERLLIVCRDNNFYIKKLNIEIGVDIMKVLILDIPTHWQWTSIGKNAKVCCNRSTKEITISGDKELKVSQFDYMNMLRIFRFRYKQLARKADNEREMRLHESKAIYS